MTLYFVTGNLGKFKEVKSILPQVEQLSIDLTEIQSLDPKVIIKAKLIEAQKKSQGEILVEDTSLYLDCLGGMPGPLIKWFMQALGVSGLAQLTAKLGNNKARAVSIFGYLDNTGMIKYYEGEVRGMIVDPVGENGFGWDSIFKPLGRKQTYAQMSMEVKLDKSINMRRLALDQLIHDLEQ